MKSVQSSFQDRRHVIGLILIVIGVAMIAVKVWQVTSTLRSLQSHLSQAQALLQSASPQIDPAQVETWVMGTRADVQSLRADVGPFLGLAPSLGWLPGVGGDLQAVPALLEMADGLTEASVLLWQGMSPLMDQLTNTPDQGGITTLMQQALTQLVTARPQVEQARAALARALAARSAIRVERLSPRLANQIHKLDVLLPLGQMAVDFALTAPEAAGMNSPRTYLILAQNSDEIRPTGGFISNAGRAVLDHGNLVELSFMDPYFVDDWTRPYPDPPDPILRYLGSGQRNELWTFRDSNWSPDFPTAARQAAYFYTYGQHVAIDGVVAVDQRAVQLLIDAVGPINLDGVQITGSNVIQVMRESWNPTGGNTSQEWMLSRKSAIGRLAAALRARVENDPGSVPWKAVARAVLQALQERHVMIYVNQPDLAESLAWQGWDGAIRPTTGDYFMVVDANVGYNKANAVITQSVSYAVTLGSDGKAQATLSIDYHHGGTPGKPCKQEVPAYGPDVTYQSMFNECYFDFLRVYVPQGTHLLDASRQHIPSDYLMSHQTFESQAEILDPEAGKSVMALFFVAESGQNHQVFFSYELPTVAQNVGGDWDYSILIQKQSGKLVVPTSVRVSLPPGAQLVSASPQPASVQAGVVQFELQVTGDTWVKVRYRG